MQRVTRRRLMDAQQRGSCPAASVVPNGPARSSRVAIRQDGCDDDCGTASRRRGNTQPGRGKWQV
jgi:hypothetical protein